MHPGVHQLIEAAADVGVQIFGAQVVQHQQVGLQQGAEILPAALPAPPLLIQARKSILRADIHHVEALLQHHTGNAEGEMGFAQARVSKQVEAGTGKVKFLGIDDAAFQVVAHQLPGGDAQPLHGLWIAFQLEIFKAAQGQRPRGVHLLAAQALHLLLHTGAHRALHPAGVLAALAVPGGGQVPLRKPQPLQQRQAALPGLGHLVQLMLAFFALPPGGQHSRRHPGLALGLVQQGQLGVLGIYLLAAAHGQALGPLAAAGHGLQRTCVQSLPVHAGPPFRRMGLKKVFCSRSSPVVGGFLPPCILRLLPSSPRRISAAVA